jgi:hypothetical protein
LTSPGLAERRVVHATGTIPDLGKHEPCWPEGTQVLTELHAEGIVKNLFRLSDRPEGVPLDY